MKVQPMNMLTRAVHCTAIAGFMLFASGCIIAPDHRDGGYRDHDHDHDDHHCDREHDDHCHD